MHVIICESMSAATEMVAAKAELELRGHSVTLPRHTDRYVAGELTSETAVESIEHKIAGDLIRSYYDQIREADAVLVVNVPKHGVAHYIGGNSFLELAFAHVIKKQCFLLNPVPNVPYADEIHAMQPVIIDGNYDLLV